MREILFRGKRRDNGEWIEGYLSKIFFAHKEYWAITRKEVIGRYAHATEYDFVSYEVYPETIGQYTGIDDKNGKKIFDGDICSLFGNADHLVAVSIRNTACGFEPVDYELVHEDDRRWKSFWRDETDDMWDSKYFEVAGNIHDNPELLKGGFHYEEE